MSELQISDIRTDYKKATLREQDVAADPIAQFDRWFEEVLHSKIEEPNAMTLATTTLAGVPSARIVLLKGVDHAGFYFYTNYESKKGAELAENPRAALVFFWKELERQVRIQGVVERASKAQSDRYFLSRPHGSQIGAWSSPQSTTIASRKELEQKVAKTKERFARESLFRPPFWGGFCLHPETVEFWQGRHSRLHDRIVYEHTPQGDWQIHRLAP